MFTYGPLGSGTDDSEEHVVEDEGDVDEGHDDPLVAGAAAAAVPGGQREQVAEAAQRLHDDAAFGGRKED